MNYLEKIFEKQQDLINSYEIIESKVSGEVHEHKEIDLDDFDYQAKLRRVAWFINEELVGEALAEYKSDSSNFKEELIDALCFTTELCIMSGVTPDSIYSDRSESEVWGKIRMIHGLLRMSTGKRVGELTPLAILAVSHSLSLAINKLKNKPWKQTKVKTEVESYKNKVMMTMISLLNVFASCDMDASDVYDIYIKKYNINKARQSGGY